MRSKRRQRSDASDMRDGPFPRRRSKFKRRVVVFLLLLVGVVSAAPAIVARSLLRNSLLTYVMPSGGWQVTTERASFTWWGDQTLNQLAIVDSQGNVLLTAQSATLTRSLFAIALNRNNLGKLTITSPVVAIITHDQGSNLEDLILAERKNTPSDESGDSPHNMPTELEIEIIDGTVNGIDRVSQQRWQLAHANLTAQTGDVLSIEGTAALRSDQQAPVGQLQIRFQQGDQQINQLEIEASDCPLEPLEPWLARTLTGAKLGGVASATLQVLWSRDDQKNLQVQTLGQLEASQTHFTASVLDGDQLRFERMVAPWQINLSGGRIVVDQLDLSGGWLNLRVQGSAPISDFGSSIAKYLPRQPASITGQLEVAKLAAMLPNMLKLRENAQLDGGELQFRAVADPQATELVWDVEAELSNLSGTDGQRRFDWQHAIEAEARLVGTVTGPELRSFRLSAPFATANFSTQQDKLLGQFQFDLEQFSEQVGQIVDLRPWQLRGRGEGRLAYVRMPDNQFRVDSKVELTNFVLSQNDRSLSKDERLAIAFHADGNELDLKPTRISSAELSVQGTHENWNVRLLPPVDLLADAPLWKIGIEGHGSLGIWADRLRPFVSSMPATLEGKGQLRATVQLEGDLVDVLESQGTVEQLKIETPRLTINEPRLQFSGDCRWSRKTKTLATKELQISGNTLTMRTRNLSCSFDPAEPSTAPFATGKVAFRGNLQRIAAALGMAGQPTSAWPRGEVQGIVDLVSDANAVRAKVSCEAQQLQVVRLSTPAQAVQKPLEVIWSEPRATAEANLAYLLDADRAELSELRLTGSSMQFAGRARLDDVQTAAMLQANGTAQYDPAALAQLVASMLGPDVQLQGDRQIRFQIAGRLAGSESASSHWSQRFNISAEAPWTGGSLYGLPLGGGQLSGTLRDGQLRMMPLDVTVGEGRLTASPQVFLAPSPTLILPKGPLLTKVALSTQVSETMLKYVAPILAGATRTEGKFSINLDTTQVPLTDPKQARVEGRLDVHYLRITPGPLVADLARMVAQIEAITKRERLLQAAPTPASDDALTMTDQKVDFQVQQRRVYHREMDFLVDDVPVRSYGSVGFDQTLALVFEIPIQQKWVDGDRFLRKMAGKLLKIPVSGTLQKPRVDQRAIAELSQQLLQETATEAIGDELNRQLEKLFRGR